MGNGVEHAPKRSESHFARPSKKPKKYAPGAGQPSTQQATSPPKPPQDLRVANKKADPMPANGHLAEDHAATAEKIEKKAEGMPPAMKEAMDNMRAAAETAVLVSTMGQVNDKNGRWKFLNTLDRIDDPAIRARVKQQFEAQTKQSLDHFIETAPWHSKRDREQAQDMVSSKRDHTEDALSHLAKENPAEYEKKKLQAIQWASLVLRTTRKDDVDHDSDAKPIFDTLGPRTPEEIEMIRAEIRKQTGGRTAYQEIDKSLSGGTEDEALAGLKGDKINAVAAGIRNADGNVKRMEELLHTLSDAEIKQLNFKAPDVAIIAIQSVPAGQREQIGDLVTGNRAHANATHIADLFKDPKDGFEMDGMMPTKQSLANIENRKTENIIKELRSMSPQDIRAARDAWNADPDNAGHSWSDMIERRFKDGDSNTLMRIRALADGNKVEERAYALREGMRKQNQTMIEEALANPDLESGDPVKKAIAITEKSELEARMIALDAKAQQAQAIVSGKDPNAVVGHSMKEQLTHYYQEYGDKVPQPKDFDSMMELMKGEEEVKAKRSKEAEQNSIASAELNNTGELSKVTQIQRAEKKGDLETKAQLLENVTSADERKKLEEDYHARTNKDVYADPRAAEFAAVARFKKEFQGDDRPLSEIQKETADESRNANEHRIHNVDLYGAKVERSAALEYTLQKEQFERQHSDSLENSEKMREMWGGNIGTEDLARHQLENMNEMFVENSNPFDMTPRKLKDGVSPDEFKARDKSVTATLELQRSEKIKHSERLAMAFSTIAKIAALLAGQPHLVFLIDAAAGLTEMAIKSATMGNDYDPTLDQKMFGLTMAVDALTLGAGKYFSGAASKLDDVVAAERTGKAAATEMAEQAVTTEAKKEIAEDAIKQVAKSEAKVAGAVAGDSVEGGMAVAKTEQAIAKAEAEVVETAAENTVQKAAKTLQRQEMVVNVGIGAANTVGAGMIQGENTDDMIFGVMRGIFGSLLPAAASAKIDKLVGQGKVGAALKYGLNVLSDVTIGGNDLKFAVAGATGNHLQARKAQKTAGGDDHVMSHLAEEPTYRANADDDGPVVTSKPAIEENPHLLAHGHNAEADHLVKAAPPDENHVTKAPAEEVVAKPTHTTQAGGAETGSSNPFNQPTKDPAAHRDATNSPQQVEQAAKARAHFTPEDQQRHAALSEHLDTPAKQALAERALAAGRSMDDVERLTHAMKGMSDNEILREFSGDGIAQFYGHSCVPTAYQIALAERDPVYALHLKNNPGEMRQGQENPLVITGGTLTKRGDMHDPPQALREQLDPQTRREFDASFEAQREAGGVGTVGIEPTLMTDQQLHKELEKATGTKYEVITNAAEPHENKGQGEYATPPYDRIDAAVDANQPVLFSQFGHEQVIVGRKPGPDGTMMYVVTDPSGARTTLVHPSQFEVVPMISITLPVNGDANGAHPNVTTDVQPTGRTRAGGVEGDESSGPTVAAKPDNLTVDRTAPARDTRGWSEQYAPEDAPHIPLIRSGRAQIPSELEQLVHPTFTPEQKKMLEVLDTLHADANKKLANPAHYDHDPKKMALIVDEIDRLDQSRANLVRSFEEQRQRTAAKNQPRAAEIATEFHQSLIGQASAETAAAAEKIAISERAQPLIEKERGGEAAVRRDVADYMELTNTTPNIQLDHQKKRANYVNTPGGTSTVNVGDTPQRKTIFHEMGHGTEADNPAIAEAAHSFRDARARFAREGVEPQTVPLKELDPSSSDGEVGVEGGFADKYTGRVYPTGETEIVSTGIEALADPKRMLELYQRDPEHFEFILGMIASLRGTK